MNHSRNAIFPFHQNSRNTDNIADTLQQSYSNSLTKVQLDKLSISRGPVKFLTCNEKNKIIIIS